jgi:hypothetical protein
MGQDSSSMSTMLNAIWPEATHILNQNKNDALQQQYGRGLHNR